MIKSYQALPAPHCGIKEKLKVNPVHPVNTLHSFFPYCEYSHFRDNIMKHAGLEGEWDLGALKEWREKMSTCRQGGRVTICELKNEGKMHILEGEGVSKACDGSSKQ